MPQYRKDRLENDYYYHVFSRSISKYIVFNNEEEYGRFTEIFELYKHKKFDHQYSKFTRLDIVTQKQIIDNLQSEKDLLVEIVAYCLMPTHLHFILKQISDHGISIFMAKILNCYARYFNLKHKRNGPLWAGRFKSVLVDKDEQLLHLTRYIHINPSSAGLVTKPQDWLNSSYHDYISTSNGNILLKYSDLFSITPKDYKSFVADREDYQKSLSKIKNIIIDDYTG